MMKWALTIIDAVINTVKEDSNVEALASSNFIIRLNAH